MYMSTLWQDLRYGLRMLLKTPGFTAIAVLSLALGIGANTAIFSLLNTAVLRPLPIEKPDEMVGFNNTEEQRLFPTFSYPNYKDFETRNQVFSGVMAYRFAPLSLSHDGINERLWGYVVTGNYFEVLGVNAALGRVISTDDDLTPGGHPVAVLSYKCWQTRFGSDLNINGKEILVNGRGYTVIGIAPQGFSGTEIIAAPEIWFPMAMQAQIDVGDQWLTKRGVENIFVQGRLKSGVSTSQAQAALNLIAADLEREYPDINEGKRVILSPIGLMTGAGRGMVVGFVSLLMAGVGLVLLLACTNLANLLLARAAERRREIGVRLALGASRFQLVRQLLTESMLLAVGGGALGLLMAVWLVDMATGLKPPIDVPLAIELHIDYRVLIFTCLLTLATGLLFGILPALQATKTDLLSALKDESGFGNLKGSRLKNGLIVFQVAVSVVLLVGGGLMLRSLQNAQTVKLGFDPQNAIELSFDLRLQGYNESQGREFQKRLLERVRALPDVQGAGIADLVPVDLHFGRRSVFIEGQLPERNANAPRAMSNRITPGYFAAMSTRLLQGRDFSEQDNETAARVVIVNETFARQFWQGEDAIGKRFSIDNPESPKLQIIGIAEDGKYAGLGEDPRAFIYRPMWQSYTGSSSLIVRGATDSQRLIAEVRSQLRELDANMPISTAKTLVERLALPLLPARLAASSLGSFGLLALALAAIGIYGVMSYGVTRRTREIGIRIALGAQQADVLNLVMKQGTRLTLIGLGLGLLASLALTRLMKNLLFGISATDPLTFIFISLLLAGVALLACYVPARRATKVDPMVALRYE
jgi:macrolide transport system ATP-binding/permease protein